MNIDDIQGNRRYRCLISGKEARVYVQDVIYSNNGTGLLIGTNIDTRREISIREKDIPRRVLGLIE